MVTAVELLNIQTRYLLVLSVILLIPGINLINSYISKQINLAHVKVIVVSEALATQGIFPFVATFMNNIEVRPDCNMIISRCNAEDFLNHAKPDLETLSARYYEQIFQSSQYTGFTTSTTLTDFYTAYHSNSYHPVAILGGINSDSTHFVNPQTPYVDMDSNYKADETPIKKNTSSEIMGLAVFQDDKLIGELTGMDSICHLMCTNEFHSTNISIPSPFHQNHVFNLDLKKNKAPSIAVSLVNGSPYIQITVSYLAFVSSMDEGLDVSNRENLTIIEKYAASYLQEKICQYLYKTSKEFHTDLVDFGKYLLPHYLTSDEISHVNWLNRYSDATFCVTAKVHVQGSYLIVKN